MELLNADGSYSEVSGNGVRCLAAWMAEQAGAGAGNDVEVLTDAGLKRLRCLERAGARWTFRAAMGQPEAVTQARIDVDGVAVEAVTLRVGNPQCVVLGDVTPERLHALASKLAVHPHFPHGTNVELAAVEAPDRVRILIWERGVGPDRSLRHRRVRGGRRRDGLWRGFAATCRSSRRAARSGWSGSTTGCI